MPAAATPKGKAPEHELRRSARVRTFFGGRIVFRDGTYSYACTVRDMSESGARVAIPEARLIPRRFFFLTSKEDVAHDCELVWRSRDMAGIKFRESIQLQTCKDPKLQYLRQIAAELRPRH
ncbi:MAG TPA: PilZ domain-containing protein [Rhizomicrobium sp.]|jgi:hypothetical protein|nr:PilZ domain-containing protein [Rhizomicrobium sp.]